MAQKDKIKELVGRGLDSYHTKALQQMDRIEKKNKEQNHKINILTNELDNDYLTKTEEGSVVSLEHSKEGMVYLDELQGNTLVNYCVDGAKELTLNGDIDAEGTNVTLTEGVDDGKVDVMCEGNTLVNCIEKISSIQNNSFTYENGIYKLIPNVSGGILLKANVKPSTTYTFIANVHKQSNVTNILIDRHELYIAKESVSFNSLTGVVVFTTKDDLSTNTNPNYNFKLGTRPETTGELWINDFIILEGDWTDKEIPPYFEGMKSVAECEDNKLEIVSQNKNLYSYEEHSNESGYRSKVEKRNNGVSVTANDNTVRGCGFIKIFAEEDLYVSLDVIGNGGVNKKLADNTYLTNYPKNNGRLQIKLEKGGNYKLELNAGAINDAQVIYDNIIISKNNYTDFVSKMLNKKEISLNEPLRSLPNGVKDNIVKIGGKWYIHRRLYGLTLNGGENEKWNMGFTNFGTPIFTWNNTGINICRTETYYSVLSDRFVYAKQYSQTQENHQCIYVYNNQGLDDSIRIQYPLNSVEEFRNYLSNNPIKVIVQLEVPTYEEITDVELITYLDTTHISNNSTIPCNMKIKNTGYNAIIKPSTQYTVAFDTDKSGEVGINLGGAKVTTTNNVATVTTPSTLTDDSLRLTGKGIKASRVRLLEGDKTNWIPSYFEGMKSSFEDKLQDDGTYKIEITSTNTDNTLSNKIQFSSIEPLRGVGNVKDRFVFKDDKLMIERNCGKVVLNGGKDENWYLSNGVNYYGLSYFGCNSVLPSDMKESRKGISDKFIVLSGGQNTLTKHGQLTIHSDPRYCNFIYFSFNGKVLNELLQWLSINPITLVYQLGEPTYEEIPFELQKIILEGYESGTLFFDTNIPPTITTTYAGETPIVKSVKLNKTEVLNNTNDINDNIVPYLMDMDYRVVCLQLEGGIENISMTRLFGGAFEMLQRDILSKRYSKEEYKYRLDAYLSANKITENEYEKLGDMLNE